MTADLVALAREVVSAATPDEQIEVYGLRARETNVRVYDGEIEHFTSAENAGIGIRVVRDHQQGFAYAGSMDREAVLDALHDARDNAGFGEPDEYNGLPDPDGVPFADLALYRDDLASSPSTDKVTIASDLERATLACDSRVRVESADYADVLSEEVVATSTGVFAHGRETGCYVMVSTLASEGDETHTGFGFSVGRSLSDLDVAKAAREGAEKAVRLLGATKPASRRLTVVLDPFVAAQFIDVLASALSGDAVLKGRSMFADRLGDEIGSAIVTLVDDPTDARAFGATAADAEGLATRRNLLIERGVLKRFVHNTYTGRRSKLSSTGSAVRAGFKGTPAVGCMALSLVPGTKSRADLLSEIDDGVLIEQVSGLHSGVNPVSGDFSTGASGVLITHGSLGAPVREFTIASTLQRMLHDVVAVGNDLEWLPMRAAGVSLVIRDVTMSGV